MMSIKENLASVLEAIERARTRSGRGDPVLLVGVSKTHPASAVREAFAAGLKDFGENRIQEALPKISEAAVPAVWHLVGHLQSNKAKKAALSFDWIHSIDSFETAGIVARTASAVGRTVKILLEVNTSGEASKHGIPPEETLSLAESLAPLDGNGLLISGLMTVGPLGGDDTANRRAFAHLRSLRDRVQTILPGCTELSMGMSGDFASAILEGSTMVRVGSAIFGTRIAPERYDAEHTE
ncbi:MAG TPA: YggS family pyridoxal phosphate-dependent enzyme [Spirochaetota bacterium]|nr:YggS family pyridoxal phosphate-dependent enzyme [Spirochaetota bacterium]